MNKAPVPCLALKQTAEELKSRFSFMFKPQQGEIPSKGRIRLEILNEMQGLTEFLGIPLQFFSYSQGGMPVMGIRIGSFAYITDIKEYSEEIFQYLEGVETLVVSALRFTPSRMHFSVDEAIDFIQKINPKKAFLTHIGHELDHEKTNAYLPVSIQLAYDGLKVSI